MATSRSLGTKWAAALVFLTRLPFMTRPSLSRPRYQARPERRERAGVLWGALDAPVGIRLEVEPLAAEQFGDDAFELRLRAAVRPRGPPPAQSHLGQQDEELLLAKGLGAAGTHAPLRRHGPAAPGLADLPLLPDQATGQRRHGAPGEDTPKPAGVRSALGSSREARSLTRTCS